MRTPRRRCRHRAAWRLQQRCFLDERVAREGGSGDVNHLSSNPRRCVVRLRCDEHDRGDDIDRYGWSIHNNSICFDGDHRGRGDDHSRRHSDDKSQHDG